MKRYTFRKLDGDYANVLAGDNINEAVERLRSMGVNFYASDCVSVADTPAEILELYVKNFKEVYVKHSEL